MSRKIERQAGPVTVHFWTKAAPTQFVIEARNPNGKTVETRLDREGLEDLQYCIGRILAVRGDA